MKKLKLRLYWCSKEKDYMVSYPNKSDGGWIFNRIFNPTTTVLPTETGKDMKLKALSPCSHNPYLSIFEVKDFIKDLEERGYDKTTLKFEIMVDINKILEHFPHIINELNDSEKEKLKQMQKSK